MTANAPETMLPVEGVPDLWPRVREAPQCLLGVDYDGTLAPFRIHRMEARSEPGTYRVLAEIQNTGRTEVAVVSGRPVADLLELLGDPGVRLIGAHGYELRLPSGELISYHPDERQREGLAHALTVARGAHLGPHLEPKIASIALHIRGVVHPEEILAKGITLWQPLASDHDLEVREFNGGLELRAKGRHKGVAITEVYTQMPPGTLPVYLGDDETDEDAFSAIRDNGIGIKVGNRGVVTAAQGYLPDPDRVIRFLESWLALCRNLKADL